MSFINTSTIDDIAHSLDISKLSHEAAKALAPDTEYRMRELIQDAMKFARHSRRAQLSVEDVNNALRMRNAEPLYGFSNKDPAKYIKAAGHPDLYCLQDKELSIEQLVDAPLARPPVEVGVMPHWLFINGVQPAIPENAPLEKPSAKRVKPGAGPAAAAAAPGALKEAAKAAEAMQHTQDTQGPATPGGGAGAAGGAGQQGQQPLPVQVQPTIQHVLSRELQLYFIKVVDLIKVAMAEDPSRISSSGAAGAGPSTPAASTPSAVPTASSSAAAGQDAAPGAAAPAAGQGPSISGATGAGPGSTAAAAAAAAAGPSGRALEAARMLNAVLASLASDPGLHPLTPYLVKFCADEVAASLRSPHSLHVLLRFAEALLRNDDIGLEPYVHQLLPALLTCLVARNIGPSGHWAVRDRAASLVRTVCVRFGDPYYNVQPRVSKTLLRALLDPSKPLTTHYGAIVGLAALGHTTVRLLLLPQIQPYMERLQPLLEPPQVDGPQLDRKGGLPDAAQVAAQAAARSDAWRVYNALLDAVAHAMRERMIEQADALVAASRPRLPAVKGAVSESLKQDKSTPKGQQAGAQGAAAAPELQPNGPSTSALPDGDLVKHDEGPARKRARVTKRPVAEVLAEAWREDCDLEEVIGALQELLGPDFTAKMPQARAQQAL